MERKELEIIAEKYCIDKVVFTEFMLQRFGKQHTTEDYILEWAERFSTGSPDMYMDGLSRAVYNAIVHSNRTNMPNLPQS